MDILHFAEVTSSRLCHDLITPVGAINTGLELLEEMGPNDKDRGDVLSLICQSAKTASIRLSFYRAAFGSSGSKVSVEDAWTLIQRFAEIANINVKLDNLCESSVPELSRLLMNIYLWTHECLPRGGSFHCTLQESEFIIHVSAPLITLQQDAQDSLLLATHPESLTPRAVPGALVQYSLQKMDKILAFDKPNPNEMILKVT